MSVWSSADGTITFKNNPHFSIKKCVASFFKNDDHTLRYTHIPGGFEFSIAVCLDGDEAFSHLRNFVALLDTEYNARCDITLSIRFLT